MSDTRDRTVHHIVTERAQCRRQTASRQLKVDSVEKGRCCDAEISVIQSVLLAGLNTMTGHRQVDHAALFYEFSLEKHIPADRRLCDEVAYRGFCIWEARDAGVEALEG